MKYKIDIEKNKKGYSILVYIYQGSYVAAKYIVYTKTKRETKKAAVVLLKL